MVGLLHDFDYQRWPTRPTIRCKLGDPAGTGLSQDVIYAILSHADYLSDRYPRVNPIDKALLRCDELAG